MNDTFYEQFLSANKSGKTMMMRILTIIGTIFA